LLLATAHQIERMVRSGEHANYAALAQELGLSRARVTQLATLAYLAPAVQDEILAATDGQLGRITERTLRAIAAQRDWADQHDLWREAVGR
jgi:hypothetical protein